MPRSQYRIDWYARPAYARTVDRRKMNRLARRALAVEKVPGPLSLGVAIVDRRTIRNLNRKFRGVDEATDVLSFALGRKGHSDEDGVLGEVVISMPVARRQAAGAGHSLDEELGHLLVHGVLHILGYDHESARGARRMRLREDLVLGEAVH